MKFNTEDYQPFLEQTIHGLEVIPGDASRRSYVRLKGESKNYIAVSDPDSKQLHQFGLVTELLCNNGLKAPKIIKQIDGNHALLEDFGKQTFAACLKEGRSQENLYAMAVNSLIKIQNNITEKPEFIPIYDKAKAMEEVSRFLSYPGITADNTATEEFRELWSGYMDVALSAPHGLALMDFHVDNLIYLKVDVSDERGSMPEISENCGLLDFQDATWAPVAFDLVSLLQDARQDVNVKIFETCWQQFLKNFPEVNHDIIKKSGMIISLNRHLRIIELFSRLAREGRSHYASHFPRLWSYVDFCLAYNDIFTPLRQWLERNVSVAEC